MPDLLFELFSEEIPARMQRQASEDLKRLVTSALVEAGVTYEGARAYATPRRLALNIVGLPARQPDTREERKGPRVGAPDAAIQGFLKGAGLASLDQAKIESDPKKGDFYVAVIEKPGRPVLDLLADILPATIRSFPWPKSMRWGAASVSSSALRWVRPLRAIVATFGAETEEPEIVPFEVDGLKAGNITYGHRFMATSSSVASPDAKPATTFAGLAPGEIRVKRFDDYVAKLEAAKVVLDADRRKDIIRHDARDLAFAQGLEVVEDEGLLEEVAGLVEWPVVLMGAFEEAYLDVPGEVIRATIRANQKCFVLRGPDGRLANRFLLISNIVPKDGGATIINGNERVIRARLSDAKFFWETDKRIWADDKDFARLEKFRNVTFHEKLGSQWDRIERIRALAKDLCAVTGADPAKVNEAVTVCKLDLQTEVVGEFPEVQGLMGRIYAGLTGLDASVAAACEEHYKPVGPGDSVPKDPVSITVALADKLDTLVGFWAIDEKPTGSKDPYALRRAALGVIRLVVENGVRASIHQATDASRLEYLEQYWGPLERKFAERLMQDYEAGISAKASFDRLTQSSDFEFVGLSDLLQAEEIAFDSAQIMFPEQAKQIAESYLGRQRQVDWQGWSGTVQASLLSFFHDRLKVMLRDQGARHDLVDAVLAPNPSPLAGEGARRAGEGANDDLLLVVQRVNALGRFLETEDGKSLVAGFKRAANILRAEEKKDGEGAFEGAADPALCREPVEAALLEALSKAGEAAGMALQKQDFEGAMRAMAALRGPVDAFFEAVMVNAEDPALRRNRLALLATLRRVTRQVADFSRIAG